MQTIKRAYQKEKKVFRLRLRSKQVFEPATMVS